ncbi:hypothetical protein V8F20_004456 [Naviculisporaceae sp. PSN 640]
MGGHLDKSITTKKHKNNMGKKGAYSLGILWRSGLGVFHFYFLSSPSMSVQLGRYHLLGIVMGVKLFFDAFLMFSFLSSLLYLRRHIFTDIQRDTMFLSLVCFQARCLV